MLTNTWRRFRSPAAWAFAMVLGTPMLAEAQQGGLFPLAPIRRERVPCPMEDPVYGLYRQEYFGYHPTCWRRFPPGWGCPSPEAPNAAASFGQRRRDPAPPLGPPDGEMDRDVPGPGPEAPRGNQLPPLPGGDRSPFELEPGREGPARNAPRTAPAPGEAPGSNPLELPPLPGEGGDRPANPPAGGATPPTTRLETAPAPGADGRPVMTLPEVGPSAGVNPGMVPMPAPMPGPGTIPPPGVGIDPNVPAFPPAASAVAPVQAPRRPSLLGGLLGRTRR